MAERVVVTTIKDEGPFLLEWVVWYVMLGFDHIVVFYNDCSDHSPQLLSALAQSGKVTPVPYAPDPKRPPKATAYPLMYAHPRVAQAEWVFVIDVDEFLVIHEGAGKIDDLIGKFDPEDTHGIAIHWKCFGDAGQARWFDTLVHLNFDQSGPSKARPNARYKSLIRAPQDFERFAAHAPKGWKGEGVWGEGANTLRRCNGNKIHGYHPDTSANHIASAHWTNHGYAQLNHYVLRCPESYALKKGTPASASGFDRYTDDYYARLNLNDESDTSARRYGEAFGACFVDIASLPQVLARHHQCCLDYLERLAAHHGFVAQEDPRWAHHAQMRRELSEA